MSDYHPYPPDDSLCTRLARAAALAQNSDAPAAEIASLKALNAEVLVRLTRLCALSETGVPLASMPVPPAPPAPKDAGREREHELMLEVRDVLARLLMMPVDHRQKAGCGSYTNVYKKVAEVLDNLDNALFSRRA